MADSVAREAFRETASALRLNRPVIAILIVAVVVVGTWWTTGRATWGGLAALAAALVLFAPLFIWNIFAVYGNRFAALQSTVGKLADNSGQDQSEAAKEMRERRRRIIDNARSFVAGYEIQKRSDWHRAIRNSADFAAVRPHLSPAYIATLTSSNAVILGNEIHEVRVEGFVRELDRLEREWGLS